MSLRPPVKRFLKILALSTMVSSVGTLHAHGGEGGTPDSSPFNPQATAQHPGPRLFSRRRAIFPPPPIDPVANPPANLWGDWFIVNDGDGAKPESSTPRVSPFAELENRRLRTLFGNPVEIKKPLFIDELPPINELLDPDRYRLGRGFRY